jgi:glycosyltransferase involved in cell wall biosynthesis
MFATIRRDASTSDRGGRKRRPSSLTDRAPLVSEAASVQAATGPRIRLALLGDPNSLHLRRWATFFAGRGHAVTLLVPHDVKVEPGLPASIAFERFSRFNPRSALAPIGFLRARRSVRNAVDRVAPDVLNAHFLTIHGWHAWMSGFHPYAVTLWGSDIYVGPRKWRAVRAMARLTLKASDLVMADSEDLKRGAEALGSRPDRTELIGWGVDLARFSGGAAPSELRTRLGLDGRRVVFSPRAIKPLYRQGVVVDALARLPSDVVAVLSLQHSDPAEVAAIERRAAELGVAGRLLLVPEIAHADMPDMLRLADVVVSIPESDSTSLAVLEAMACERQVVAADLPSVREWLGELDPDSLVPVGDVEATASALARALGRSAAEREELGRRARAIVRERADQETSLGNVERLYLGLCHPRGSAR